jgi:hypothetical protein
MAQTGSRIIRILKVYKLDSGFLGRMVHIYRFKAHNLKNNFVTLYVNSVNPEGFSLIGVISAQRWNLPSRNGSIC